jgi:diacylglycerol kinase
MNIENEFKGVSWSHLAVADGLVCVFFDILNGGLEEFVDKILHHLLNFSIEKILDVASENLERVEAIHGTPLPFFKAIKNFCC